MAKEKKLGADFGQTGKRAWASEVWRKVKAEKKARLTAPDPQTPAKNLSLSIFQSNEKITTSHTMGLHIIAHTSDLNHSQSGINETCVT